MQELKDSTTEGRTRLSDHLRSGGHVLVTPTRLDQSPGGLVASKLITISSDAFLNIMDSKVTGKGRTVEDKDTLTVAQGKKRTLKRRGENLPFQATAAIGKISQDRSDLAAETPSASGQQHQQLEMPLDYSMRYLNAASKSNRHRDPAKRASTISSKSQSYSSCCMPASFPAPAVYAHYAKYACLGSNLQGRPTMVERYEPSFQPPIYRFKLPHPHGTIPPHTMTFTAVNRHPTIPSTRGRRGKASDQC